MLVLASGCWSGPGGPFALGATSHRLLPAAREVRQPVDSAVAVPRELEKQVLPPYVIEAGDVLLVQPADLDSPLRLPGDQPVLPDGTISLGRYGLAMAAGKSVEELQEEVRLRIEAQVPNPGPIVVRVMVRQSKVFYVLGEVNAPGAYPLAGRETVLDAILAAGGLNDRASHRNIVLSRPTSPAGCRVVLPVCYDEIVQLGDTTTNYQLAPGDRVFVPGRSLCEDWRKKKNRCQLPCPSPLLLSSPPSSPTIPPQAAPTEVIPAPWRSPLPVGVH
jgi:protein involved in polysaccharide export with SLBB domain